MTELDNKAKGPGQHGRGNREGFSFDEGRREGRDRDGRGGRGKKEGGGAGYRVVNELSTLEKALTKADYTGQKASLDEVLKALRSLHLKSVGDLDLNTRGRLITSLMRVLRQPKPKQEEVPAGEAAPAVETPAVETSEVETSATETPATETPAVETSATETPAAAAASPAKAAVDPKQQWTDVMYSVGLIWRAAGDVDRGGTAFELAGKQPSDAELASLKSAPVAERAPAARTERPDRGPRTEKRERRERPERKERFPNPVLFVSSGDWQADVKKLEEMGRTRDAGRMHEKNKSYADSARLFAVGGDLKSAFRCAALGKLEPLLTELTAKLKPDEIVQTLERAEAWEQLMTYHVGRQDFDAMARLYERARQFDQAAIAWERGGKLAAARKAYERMNDTVGANRMRDLEVKKLIERGDRLGAATLLVGAGLKAEAVESLKSLPPPKAYHFMEKLKLVEEAQAYAREELAKSQAAGSALHVARWLELLGEKEKAIETYLAADRKDKAAGVYETMGQFAKAAELMEASGHLDKAGELFKRAGDTANAQRVAALPRPEPKPAAVSSAAETAEATEMPPPSPGVSGPQSTPVASP